MKGEIKSLPSAGSALSNAYLHLKDRCVFAHTVVYVCLIYKHKSGKQTVMMIMMMTGIAGGPKIPLFCRYHGVIVIHDMA